MEFNLNRNKKNTEIKYGEVIETLEGLVEKNIKINFLMNISYEAPFPNQNPKFALDLVKNYFIPEENYEVKGKKSITKLKTRTKYHLELHKNELRKKEDNRPKYEPIRSLTKNSIIIDYILKK